MTTEEKIVVNAAGAAMGAASGIATGLAKTTPLLTTGPVSHAPGMGAMNGASKFFDAATKAMKHHKGVSTVLGAGAAAAVPHGAVVAAAAVGTAAVAAAPFVLGAAAVGAALWGIKKWKERLS
jgi:hypothetical protein